jgi:hypothetical protein
VAICEKSFVKDVADTDGTAAELLELPEPLEEPLLPQAARTRAAPPATAARPALLVVEYKQTTSLMGQDASARTPMAGPHDGHCGHDSHLGEQ